MRRRVILTADDFGLALPVNAAIARAHRDGVLTAASLMVGEAAAGDAVALARTLPGLHVGLHVVVVNGRPVLPPERIPDLVRADGTLHADLARAGVTFFFRPGIRAQLEAEIRAQFERFAATGLSLDHVNAQNHLHLHPTVFGIILRIARDYGLPPVRVPWEPFGPSWRATHDHAPLRVANSVLLAPWLGAMKVRLRRAGVAFADRVFGLSDVGRMTHDRVLAYVRALPPGDTEIFFHLATGAWDGMDPALRTYRFADELATLTDGALARALHDGGIERIGYAALRAPAA